MRKPRDYDAELKALDERARHLRNRRREQLGDVVIATGADALSIDMLTGALLAAAQSTDNAAKEGWRQSGAAFFQQTTRDAAAGTDRYARRRAKDGGGTQPTAADPGAS